MDFTLYDGRKIKMGDYGGTIASPRNLAQSGACWVFPGCSISGDAYVSGNANAALTNTTVVDDAVVMGDVVLEKTFILEKGYAAGCASATESTIRCDSRLLGCAKLENTILDCNAIVNNGEFEDVTIDNASLVTDCPDKGNSDCCIDEEEAEEQEKKRRIEDLIFINCPGPPANLALVYSSDYFPDDDTPDLAEITEALENVTSIDELLQKIFDKGLERLQEDIDARKAEIEAKRIELAADDKFLSKAEVDELAALQTMNVAIDITADVDAFETNVKADSDISETYLRYCEAYLDNFFDYTGFLIEV